MAGLAEASYIKTQNALKRGLWQENRKRGAKTGGEGGGNYENREKREKRAENRLKTAEKRLFWRFGGLELRFVAFGRA